MEQKSSLVLTVSLFVVSLFLLITLAAWFVLSIFSDSIQKNLEKVYRSQAQSVGEQIGSQFFERYADVHAMANVVAQFMEEPQTQRKLTDLLNSYVSLYRVYDLIMVVDPQGQMLAVNNRNMVGIPVDVGPLRGKNFKGENWFAKPRARIFTEDARRQLQGAYFYITEVDPEVVAIFQDTSPKALFSTLVKKDEKILGVIVNHTRLDWLTEEVRQQYAKLVRLGMGATTLRVVDGKGQVLASFGPDDRSPAQIKEAAIALSVPIESSRFPVNLDWRVEVFSPSSDVRQFIQYWRIYYILLATFFILATSMVVGYFGKQFKTLSKQYEESKIQQEQLEIRVRERTHDLEDNIQELKHMQDRVVAQEKMVGLGIMATGLAHEIRNPLNIVLNSAQLLKEHYLPGKEKEISDKEAVQFADMIVKHSERIDSLVKSILLSARKERGVLSVVNINELASDALSATSNGFEMKDGLKVKTELIQSRQPAVVNADVEDLRRVFLNLIDNALYSVSKKWGPEQIDKARVVVEVSTDEKNVKIEIRDNGLGISEEDIKNIFVPFFTTKEPGKGTGLGLVISRDVLRKYGGTLEVASKQGEYCTFLLQLPAFSLKS